MKGSSKWIGNSGSRRDTKRRKGMKVVKEI